MDEGSDPLQVAQYLRMSTEQQKYSIEHQRAQLEAYAAANGYEVVASFIDEGKSGLSLKGRPALRDLIGLVVSGAAPFQRVLVLDVSRWGRFQNPDEAAHLEFICREAGVPVEYVAEPFASWTGPAAAIVKSIKRIMAAEYSRELSARVKVAQLIHAKEGFKQGGRAPFGVRRRVIDFEGVPRQQLRMGERKNLASDRVKLIRGPKSETATVKRIFHEYAVENRSLASIARRLNKDRAGRRTWTIKRVAAVLDSPNVQGVYRYNVRSAILGSPKRLNPESEWVERAFAHPLVPEDVHASALAKRRARRLRRWTEADLIDGLKALLSREGKLNRELISQDADLPSPYLVLRRFGTLEAAYEKAGFRLVRPCKRPMITTEEALVDGLHRLLETHGRLSGAIIAADPDLPSLRAIRKHFGALGAAFERAGYGLERRAGLMQARIRARRPKTLRPRIPDGELIAPLKRLLAEHGYLSGKMIEADRACACLPTYIDRFGSILVAYRLAGWSVTRGEVATASRRRAPQGAAPVGGWTVATLTGRLREAHMRHGRLSARLITTDPALPCADTVARVFGSLRKAYSAIGIEARNVD